MQKFFDDLTISLEQAFTEDFNGQIDIQQSVENALSQEYKPAPSKSHQEFMPFMFRHEDDSKWIHSIAKLAHKLQAKTFADIHAKGYNVDDYYNFNCLNFNTKHYQYWKNIQDTLHKIVQEVTPLVTLAEPTQEQVAQILEQHLQQNYEGFPFYSNQIPSMQCAIMNEKYALLFPIEQYASDVYLFSAKTAYGIYLKNQLSIQS